MLFRSPVTRDNLEVKVTASGVIRPLTPVNISPKEPGRITAILVDQGDRVRTGPLLADEPTGALDSRTTAEVLDLFEALHQGGMTVVMVTHEDDVAARAQHTVLFRDGAIAA